MIELYVDLFVVEIHGCKKKSNVQFANSLKLKSEALPPVVNFSSLFSLSVCLSVCLSTYLSVCLSVSIISISVCRSVSLFLSLSLSLPSLSPPSLPPPSLSLSFSPSLSVSVSVSVIVSVSVSVSRFLLLCLCLLLSLSLSLSLSLAKLRPFYSCLNKCNSELNSLFRLQSLVISDNPVEKMFFPDADHGQKSDLFPSLKILYFTGKYVKEVSRPAYFFIAWA